jgi:hypothetical protein
VSPNRWFLKEQKSTNKGEIARPPTLPKCVASRQRPPHDCPEISHETTVTDFMNVHTYSDEGRLFLNVDKGDDLDVTQMLRLNVSWVTSEKKSPSIDVPKRF